MHTSSCRCCKMSWPLNSLGASPACQRMLWNRSSATLKARWKPRERVPAAWFLFVVENEWAFHSFATQTSSKPLREPFWCLSVEIDHSLGFNKIVNVSDLLNHYFRVCSEHMIYFRFDVWQDGVEVEYKCETCSCSRSTLSQRYLNLVRCDASSTMVRLIRLPRVLAIHLKRFRYNTDGQYRIKRADQVMFDPKLDMGA